MRAEISRFLAYIAAERGLFPKTIAAYSHDLAKFEGFAIKRLGEGVGVEDITQDVISQYMQFLANTGYRKPNSNIARGRKMATLKSFFKYLLLVGRITSEPGRLKMPKIEQKEPSYLTEQEYKQLLRVVKKNTTFLGVLQPKVN